MKDSLLQLGFSEKSAEIYLRLIELGIQPASVIAQRLGYPKSTVLFLMDEMERRGIVRKTTKGNTQYFSADITDLEASLQRDINSQNQALKGIIPLLHQIQGTHISAPKVTLFDGLESCKKAYLMLLKSETTIYELGNYADLEKAFGTTYMENFVRERAKLKIELRAIGNTTTTHKLLKKQEKKGLREIRFMPNIYGVLYSSFSVFDNKIFLLNTTNGINGVLIEDANMASTFRTMYECMWQQI